MFPIEKERYPYLWTLMNFLYHKDKAYSRYLINYFNDHGESFNESIKNLERIEAALMRHKSFIQNRTSFSWSGSPEGRKYWSDLNYKYMKLVKELINKRVLQS